MDDHSTIPPDDKNRDRALMREATAWFMRQAASDFSGEERAGFDAWRKRSPAHDRAFEEVRALWDSPDMSLAVERVAGATDVETITHASSRRSWTLVRVTAVAAVALVSLALWSVDVSTRLKADYATATGEQRVVTLPDQSVVVLNTGTAIAVEYSPRRRQVKLLRGEASFTVQPDTARPFTVDSHGVTATALGTRFLVRNRRDEVQVTVLHGSVEVAGDKGSFARAVRLATGDQVSVGPRGTGLIAHVDPATTAAWMQGRLVFVRTPLEEVIRELGRYHQGYVVIWNPLLRTLPVTGIYNLSDPPRILVTLADTLPIHMVRMTDRVIILR